MEKYLLVCKILKPQGLKGQVRVYSTTTFKDIRYKKGNKLFLKNNDTYTPLTVDSFFPKGGNIDVLGFKEFNTVEEIEKILGKELFALKDESILFDDEYFIDDLKSLDVFNEENKLLGHVSDILENYYITTIKVLKTNQKNTFTIPFNDFFVKSIDLENKKMIIHEIEGLLYNGI